MPATIPTQTTAAAQRAIKIEDAARKQYEADHPNGNGWDRTSHWIKESYREMVQKPPALTRRQRTEREMDDRFWLILREPHCVPERKGPWPAKMTAQVLREFMDARSGAFITVLTIGHDGGPIVQDGPECLEMIDGRSMPRAERHRASSAAAFAYRT